MYTGCTGLWRASSASNTALSRPPLTSTTTPERLLLTILHPHQIAVGRASVGTARGRVQATAIDQIHSTRAKLRLNDQEAYHASNIFG